MHEALSILGPLFLFMLIPVWIPLVASLVGMLLDIFRGSAGDRREALQR